MLFYRFSFLIVACFMAFGAVRADEAVHYNRLSLQATAEQEIVPDLMRITLYSELRDKDSARLAEATTKILNVAIEKARLVEGVSIQLGERNTYSVADKKVLIWNERAKLHLESRDFATLSALTAELMGDLKIASHYFLISSQRQKDIENLLIKQAITAFGERADIAMQALGGKAYKIVQLNLDNQGNIRPFMSARNMEMVMSSPQSDALVPQIEAGTREVTIVVQGMIEIEM